MAGKRGLERVISECGVARPNAAVELVVRSFWRVAKSLAHGYAIFFNELGWTAPTVIPQTMSTLRSMESLKEMLAVARQAMAEEIGLQSHLLDPLWKLFIGRSIGCERLGCFVSPMPLDYDPLIENVSVNLAPYSIDATTGDPIVFWITVCPFKARDLRPVTLRHWASGWVGRCGNFAAPSHDARFYSFDGPQDPHRFEAKPMLSCLGYVVQPSRSLWVYINTGRGFFSGKPVLSESLQYCRNRHTPYPLCSGEVCETIPAGRIINVCGGSHCPMLDTSIHSFESYDVLLDYYGTSVDRVVVNGVAMTVDQAQKSVADMRGNPLMYLRPIDTRTYTALRKVVIRAGLSGVPSVRVCDICGAGGSSFMV
jgi:hypothetical protein